MMQSSVSHSCSLWRLLFYPSSSSLSISCCQSSSRECMRPSTPLSFGRVIKCFLRLNVFSTFSLTIKSFLFTSVVFLEMGMRQEFGAQAQARDTSTGQMRGASNSPDIFTRHRRCYLRKQQIHLKIMVLSTRKYPAISASRWERKCHLLGMYCFYLTANLWVYLQPTDLDNTPTVLNKATTNCFWQNKQ